MSDDPKLYNNPNRLTLDQTDISGLGDAMLVLAREVWVLTDRMSVMEAVLARRGIDISKDIEAFQPDDEMQKHLNEHGRKFIADITNAIARNRVGSKG